MSNAVVSKMIMLHHRPKSAPSSKAFRSTQRLIKNRSSGDRQQGQRFSRARTAALSLGPGTHCERQLNLRSGGEVFVRLTRERQAVFAGPDIKPLVSVQDLKGELLAIMQRDLTEDLMRPHDFYPSQFLRDGFMRANKQRFNAAAVAG